MFRGAYDGFGLAGQHGGRGLNDRNFWPYSQIGLVGSVGLGLRLFFRVSMVRVMLDSLAQRSHAEALGQKMPSGPNSYMM